MKNYLKHIDDFFREKLGRYRETPPPDVWEALDKQLDGLIPSATAPRHSLRWLGHVAMVAIVAAISVPLVKKIAGARHEVVKTEAIAISPEVKAETSMEGTLPNTIDPSSANNAEKKVVSGPAQNERQTTAERGSVANTGVTSNGPGTGSKHKEEHGTTRSVTQSATAKATKSHYRKVKNRRHGDAVSDKSTVAGNEGKAKSSETSAATNNYNSSAGNDAVVTNEAEKHAAQPSEKAQPVAKTGKKESIRKVAKKEQAPVVSPFGRLEAGLKIGYERGFNNDAAQKYVVAPYLQYNLSPKIALMTQPAVKYAQLRTRNIGQRETYYKLNHDGRTVQDGEPQQTGTIGGTGVYTTKYTYSETHDLITKSYTAGGNYLELELPLLLKFKIGKKASVYGGANVVYHKFGVTEHTAIQHGVVRSADFTTVTVGLPTSIPTGGGLDYDGNSFSNYKGPEYGSPRDKVNIGYMLGLSYECCNRWLLDALVEQTPSNRNMADGYNLNAPVSAPYIRLSAGYKFVK